MKYFFSKYTFMFSVLLASSASVFAAQTATGPVTLWSVSQIPGFSLISVGGGGNAGGAVLCSVDATNTFGSTLMSSAASAAAQGADVTLTCSDLGQAQQLQMAVGGD